MLYRLPLGPFSDAGTVERWMEQLLGGAPVGSCGPNACVEPKAARLAPAVDLWADEQSLYAAVNVPGFAMDQLEVEVHEGVLTLRGKHGAQESTAATEASANAPATTVRWFRRERPISSFERRFELPFDVEVDGVEATLEQGVLHVRLPKAKQAMPRKIAVKSQDSRSSS